MALKAYAGNILTASTEFIVNPVNCLGVSGAGLAAQFATEYPDAQAVYRAACEQGVMTPGMALIVPKPGLIFFPTKDDWRQPSRPEWIHSGLRYLYERWRGRTWRPNSVAFPELGCGLGGLDPAQVRRMISRFAAAVPFPVEIWQLPGDERPGSWQDHSLSLT